METKVYSTLNQRKIQRAVNKEVRHFNEYIASLGYGCWIQQNEGYMYTTRESQGTPKFGCFKCEFTLKNSGLNEDPVYMNLFTRRPTKKDFDFILKVVKSCARV